MLAITGGTKLILLIMNVMASPLSASRHSTNLRVSGYSILNFWPVRLITQSLTMPTATFMLHFLSTTLYLKGLLGLVKKKQFALCNL